MSSVRARRQARSTAHGRLRRPEPFRGASVRTRRRGMTRGSRSSRSHAACRSRRARAVGPQYSDGCARAARTALRCQDLTDTGREPTRCSAATPTRRARTRDRVRRREGRPRAAPCAHDTERTVRMPDASACPPTASGARIAHLRCLPGDATTALHERTPRQVRCTASSPTDCTNMGTTRTAPCPSHAPDTQKSWRRPIFPKGCPLSIFGAGELNFRVRDGNGCGLSATVTRIPAKR